MSFFEERAARNEALFREVNEQVEILAARLHEPPEPIGFLCECSNGDCSEHVFLTRSEYEQVRRDSRRFILLPGHEAPEIERVVERQERYLVVEKHGTAGVIAEKTDPR